MSLLADRQLPSEERDSLMRHLQSCATCAAEHRQTGRLSEMLHRLEVPDPGERYWQSLQADLQRCLPQATRGGTRAWRYALVGLVALVFVSFSVLALEQRDRVLETLVRGLQNRNSKLAELAWEATATNRFDEGIQRALGRDILSVTWRVAWAQTDGRICAATSDHGTVRLDGTQTTSQQHEGTREHPFAPWEVVGVFDGEATLTVWLSSGERREGLINVVSGRGIPINEFSWKMGLFDRSEWLSLAVETGKVTKYEKADLDGTECWYVELDADPANHRPLASKIWIAPRLDFCVVREEWRGPDVSLRREVIRTDFTECSSGGKAVWLPRTVISKSYYWQDERWPDRPWFTSETSIEKVTLEVADDALFLGLTLDDLPPGYTYTVCDSHRSAVYRVPPRPTAP